ncbi:MAG TPA: hypothetical protein IGS40_07820 [Trichormus sp. M33_DOE_039]|nr:hypothetical protein [Trichormus sp. M33_DOE_039]
MKVFTPGDLIALGGLILATVTTLIGGVVWYANSEKKKYAAERDFNHIKNNFKQMSEGIANEFKDLNDRFDDVDKELLRIEAYLIRTKPDHDPS